MTRVRMGILAATLLVGGVQAQEIQLRDPWLPEAVKSKRASALPEPPPTRGAALQAEVRMRLKSGFDAADSEGRGSISREQARAAGLGLIAREFERIDSAGSGRITFDDYLRFLRGRGAAL